jgi:hypothetical protein
LGVAPDYTASKRTIDVARLTVKRALIAEHRRVVELSLVDPPSEAEKPTIDAAAEPAATLADGAAEPRAVQSILRVL